MAAWLAELALSPSQAAAMARAGAQVRADLDRLDTWEDQVDARELASLGPLYHRLLAGEAVTEAELEAARAGLGQPEAERLRIVRAALDRAGTFVASLDAPQKTSFKHALFLLREPVSPQVAPQFWDGLVGWAWDAGDFGSLARVRDQPPSADLGGLWSVDGVDSTAAIDGLRLQVLATLALAHPALPGALAARAP
jgi:hypothetical protein